MAWKDNRQGKKLAREIALEIIEINKEYEPVGVQMWSCTGKAV